MTPEHWQQIKQLFDAALTQPIAQRTTFLVEACQGDEALRQQVEAMLGVDTKTDDLLDRPAYAVAAELLTDPAIFQEDANDLAAGLRLGNYQLISEIGRGGMGQVWLAHEQRLDRYVALKLLPARFTGELERIRRFQREARAASALSHPNILTIFDIGQTADRHYIATEYIEGQPLRQLIGSEELLSPGKAVEIGIQIAQALQSAHQAGIIHRDIKPENVMLRKDGYVKVLDFGLAKLLEAAPVHSDENTSSIFQTRSGVIMGTASYMSPEQARGEHLDVRTDIFSLGVVLYEMIAGRRPFSGATTNHLMVAILDEEPPPLPEQTPTALVQIINRALRKDRDKRYQTTGELLVELKAVQMELISASHLLHAAATGMASHETNTMTSALSVFARLGQRRFSVTAFLGVAVLVAGLGFVMTRWMGWKGFSREPFLQPKVTRFTSSGNVSGTISPDGKYVAVIARQGNETAELSVRQTVGSGVVTLGSFPRAVLRSVAFSPDSNFVYYVLGTVDASENGTLFRVPTLGGSPQKLLTNISTIYNSSFSPDGQRLVYPRRSPAAQEESLVLANIDGANEQNFMTLAPQSSIWGTAWSPDGKRIAYAIQDYRQPKGQYYYVAQRSVQGGNETMLVPPQQRWVARIAWLPDGRGLICNAMDETTGRFQLYHLTVKDGAIRRLTADVNNYTNPVLTVDGRTILFGQTERPASVWLAPLHDAQRAKQLLTWGANYGEVEPYSEGKLVYETQMNIWLGAVDGTQPRQLTSDSQGNTHPVMSPDGSFVVFTSRRTGRQEIWRMNVDGTRPTQLTTNGGQQPHCSPDGQWVVYEDQSEMREAGNMMLWKVPLAGGAAQQVTTMPASHPAYSPDGKWLAYQFTDATTKRNQVAIVPVDGGVPHKVLELSISAGSLCWTRDSQALVFIASNNHEIKLQPLTGGAAQTLLSLPDESIFSCAITPDGQNLLYVRGRLTSDLVLLTDQK